MAGFSCPVGHVGLTPRRLPVRTRRPDAATRAESKEFDHLFAAVRRIADEALTLRIDHEIEHFPRYLADQDWTFIGQFDHVGSRQ